MSHRESTPNERAPEEAPSHPQVRLVGLKFRFQDFRRGGQVYEVCVNPKGIDGIFWDGESFRRQVPNPTKGGTTTDRGLVKPSSETPIPSSDAWCHQRPVAESGSLAEGLPEGHCIFLHQEDCRWVEYCGEN